MKKNYISLLGALSLMILSLTTQAQTQPCADSLKCEIEVILTDSYGDGWNGAYLTVYDATNQVFFDTLGVSFTNGSTDTNYLSVCNGAQLEFILTENGSYPSEVGLEVNKNGINFIAYPAGFTTVDSTIMGYMVPNCFIACLDPISLSIDSTTESSISLSWISDTNSTINYVEYGPVGFTQGTGTLVSVTGDNLTLTSLPSGTEYDFYVYSECGVSSSNSSQVVTGNTALCADSNQCVLDIVLVDSYGDGWDGTEITIVDVNTGLNVAVLGGNFTSGYSQTLQIPICDKSDIEIQLSNIGNYTSEKGLEVSLNGLLLLDIQPGFNAGFVGFPQDTVLLTNNIRCFYTCSLVDSLWSDNVQFDSFDFGFNGDTSTSTYMIEYGPVGFTQGTGTTQNATQTIENVTSTLFENSTFDFYVLDTCFSPRGPLQVYFPCRPTTGNITSERNPSTLSADYNLSLNIDATEGSTVVWDLGNGAFSNEDSITVVYSNQTATYVVSATITNPCGDVVTLFDTIEVTYSALNIDEFDTNSQIYPNPTNGIVTISGAPHNSTIKVMGITGKLVFERTFNVTTEVDLTGMSKGVYIVKVNEKVERLILK